jgi:hypothetical protein
LAVHPTPDGQGRPSYRQKTYADGVAKRQFNRFLHLASFANI